MTPPKPDVQKRPRGTGYVTPVWQAELGWRFKARFPDGAGGERTIGTYAAEEDAHQQLNAHVQARAGRLLQPAGESLYSFGERWIDRGTGRNVRSWRSTWRTVVAAAPFAQYPLDGITPADVEDWAGALLEHVSTRGRPISRQTAKHALGLVRRCLDAARKARLLAGDNPGAAAALPPSDDPDDDPAWTYLEQPEIDRLLGFEALPAKQRAAFAVAIYAGLRQGELAALTWEGVDLRADRPRLLVRASWDTRTKSRKARRVSLLPAARAALQAWWEASKRPAAGLVWPSKVRGERHARGYDWGWAETRDHRAGVCWIGWRRRAGIARPVRFHDLRHTCASHLVSGTWGRAWSLAEVQAELGHESPSTTARYAHLSQTALDRAAAETTGIRPQSVGADQTLASAVLAQVMELARQSSQRAVWDSNPGPLAPEAEGRAGESRAYAGADGLRTDLLELVDRMRRGESPGRAEGEAVALAALHAAGELARLAGAVLAAEDAVFCSRLLALLERLAPALDAEQSREQAS